MKLRFINYGLCLSLILLHKYDVQGNENGVPLRQTSFEIYIAMILIEVGLLALLN
jgi:hypothetical protein